MSACPCPECGQVGFHKMDCSLADKINLNGTWMSPGDCTCNEFGLGPRMCPIHKPAEEFCKYCGAGNVKFRREGEGTCGKCDPKGKQHDDKN